MAPGLQLPRRLQHILDKDPVPRRRIVHQHMGHRPDQPAVLQDRAAGHEWLSLWTTRHVCIAFSFVLVKANCFLLRCMVKYPEKKVCFIS